MTQRKILFTATIADHFRCFHLPTFKWFKEQGWDVHAAASGDQQLPYVDNQFDLPFQRSPFRLHNIAVYRKLKQIIDHHDYTLVHCHTPMGGVLTRLAASRARIGGTKLVYTAHGFHFYKGAPLLSWLLYYPIEKALARLTDCLITINHEDYQLATNHKFRAELIKHIHGVGVDTERFQPISAAQKRVLKHKQGYDENQILIFYAAEFNHNKNHQLLLHALSHIHQEFPQLKLLLAGDGPLLKDCIALANHLDIADQVEFLGYRNDIQSLLPMCDMAAAPSYREGLPVNVMEAMACGLPIIASNNRGHRELVQNAINGYVVPQFCEDAFAKCIQQLAANPLLRDQFGNIGRRIIEEFYSLNRVKGQLEDTYIELTEGWEVPLWATL